MSDKALNRATLELTQKIQMHFPPDIDPDIVQAWNGCPKEVISANLAGIFGKMPEMVTSKQPELLLEPIGTVNVPATTERFVAKDCFVKDISRKAKVKISYLGGNFVAWFLGKTEEPIPETTLRYAKLRKPSADGPIIAELGGAAKIETTLIEAHALMAKQPEGEDGVLFNNGWANIFYIQDINSTLRTVSVFWYDVGWRVNASSVEDPAGWNDGSRVFSSNSES